MKDVEFSHIPQTKRTPIFMTKNALKVDVLMMKSENVVTSG